MELRGDVTIVPLELHHAAATFAWVSDPEVSRALGLRSTPSLAATRAWIERAQQDETTRAFAILRGADHVGNVVLDRLDTHLGTARLSIYLGPADARGQGVGRTAMVLALTEAFERMQLHKVWLHVHEHNTAARRSYERLGFVVEGRLRDEFWLDGQRVAVDYLGLLAAEFHQLKAGVRGASD